jgi:competence protein ComFB
MNIHNQRETQVISFIDEIFAEERGKAERAFCTCSQCMLDVACYVLNRLDPRYVVSERGVAHTEHTYPDKVQETADIAALIHEGIDRVSALKRPDFPHDDISQTEKGAGVAYNFPIIKGRVFNGNTFEPVSEIDVYLRMDTGPVEMVDPNWKNPCHIYSSGSFFFLPKPLPVSQQPAADSFKFEILIEDDRFEILRHFFIVTPVKGDAEAATLHANEGFSTEDLYLFEKEAGQ